jgi:hypothetical protein
MESRDLPDVVKATFGVGSALGVKLLTSATWLQKEHKHCWPVLTSSVELGNTHSILRFASQYYHCKSQIPNPDPHLFGGLGQQ